MTIQFQLDGQTFTALNGGPIFKFTEAVSFVIHCKNQEDVNHYWNRLLEGGQPSQCGWLKDKYGLSWQIVPDRLIELLTDPARAGRVMKAMMPMKKIIIADLEAA